MRAQSETKKIENRLPKGTDERKISFITTCKGRLEHLKQTLPNLIRYSPDEVIVVDAGCPDRIASWIKEHGLPVKVIEEPMDRFHLTRARNIGAKIASNPVLCFWDADIMISSDFIPWIKTHWRAGSTYAVRKQNHPYDGIHEQGTVVCAAQDFKLIGGYDEMYNAYGGEDHDLKEKLSRSGLRQQSFPQKLLQSLPHNDEIRTRFYKEKNKKMSSIKNRLYAAAKRTVLGMLPGMIELPLETRKIISDKVESGVKDWVEGTEFKKLRLEFSAKAWLPPPYRMLHSISIELSVEEV